MSAGFLVTRLLLVFLISEVEHNSRFATAQPPASQGLRNPYDYLPLQQHVQHERQLPDSLNPWAKIVEGLMKNRQHPGANHQLVWPQQIQNPYQHLPQIRVKYPSDAVSQSPAPKKIEFNVNVPLQHILKTLAFAKKGPEWFRDFREGDFSRRVNPVSYQEGAGGPFWSEPKGLPRETAKRKLPQGGGNPGLNFRFSAPMPGHRDRRLNPQRQDNLAYLLSQSGLVKQSPPEFGLERPLMHHGLGLHPCFGPAQMTPSGCPLVSQGQVNQSPPQQQIHQQIHQPIPQEKLQQQIPQQQLPILSQILTAGHDSISGGNLWTQEIAKQLPHFHLSIGNTPISADQKPLKAPEPKRPQSSSGVYPRLSCSHPEARSSRGEPWVLCPRLSRGWIH